ncbi:MAG: GGDEF domain-containing protein [Lachnospiraceae bacterium]|nr:GGDEF domain-containing protein [Lachnospiraceae bacterium]
MNNIIVTADIVCVLFLLIILFGSVRSPQKKELSTKLFIFNSFSAIIGTIFDALSYYLDGVIANDVLLTIINLITYLICIDLLLVYAFYIVLVLSEKTEISYRGIIPVILLSGVNMILFLVGTILGRSFTIVNHKYVIGPWDSLHVFLSSLCLGYLLLLILFYRNTLEKIELLSLASYMVIPITGVLIRQFFRQQDFIYLSVSLACAFNYVMIQSRTILKAEIRAQILNEAFHTDSLTSLKNRRSYDEMLNKERKKESFSVIFADLNQLKYTNDNFGHEAGDQLLIRFANLLRESFPTENIYRISGDEFVVILEEITDIQMDELIGRFRKQILKNDQIASFGFVNSKSDNILKVIREAENLMNKDKTLFYQSIGKIRRT